MVPRSLRGVIRTVPRRPHTSGRDNHADQGMLAPLLQRSRTTCAGRPDQRRKRRGRHLPEGLEHRIIVSTTGGHVHASQPDGRRRRRNHSEQFKAEAIAACRQPGISIAAAALARQINANLLRRWGALPLSTRATDSAPIQIEIRRGKLTLIVRDHCLAQVSWSATSASAPDRLPVGPPSLRGKVACQSPRRRESMGTWTERHLESGDHRAPLKALRSTLSGVAG